MPRLVFERRVRQVESNVDDANDGPGTFVRRSDGRGTGVNLVDVHLRENLVELHADRTRAFHPNHSVARAERQERTRRNACGEDVSGARADRSTAMLDL